MPINDNHPTPPGVVPAMCDTHGQAALLLVESLIHGLCEHAVLTAQQAIEIADRAVDVQGERAEAADDAAAALWRSHALLASIAASLRIDEGRAPVPVA